MLTAAVSHDMRTPLNAMIGLLQNMNQFVSDEKGLKFLKIISSSSKILLYLVNDLLDFMKLKNAKFTKNEQMINLKQSVSELLDIFRVAIAEKGIQLHYVCSERMPEEVVTDAQRINQVLINLMQNAVKFTMQGSITVEMDYETSIDMLRVTVRDTGIGIKNEDKGKLFKMFGKLEDTAVINTSGIGLGLSICKQIV